MKLEITVEVDPPGSGIYAHPIVTEFPDPPTNPTVDVRVGPGVGLVKKHGAAVNYVHEIRLLCLQYPSLALAELNYIKQQEDNEAIHGQMCVEMNYSSGHFFVALNFTSFADLDLFCFWRYWKTDFYIWDQPSEEYYRLEDSKNRPPD